MESWRQQLLELIRPFEYLLLVVSVAVLAGVVFARRRFPGRQPVGRVLLLIAVSLVLGGLAALGSGMWVGALAMLLLLAALGVMARPRLDGESADA